MPGACNLVLAFCLAVAQPPADDLPGLYDGGAPEVAAMLSLERDGRFRYALSYGALDERAEGAWIRDGDRLLLTSDPVDPPAFDLVAREDGPEGELIVTLAADPRLPVQLFDVEAGFADGRTETVPMNEEGARIAFAAGDPPRSVRLLLPMFDVAGAPIALGPAGGYRLRFAFRANDLGRVAFRATPLSLSPEGLRLMRHDRLLVFRRVSPGEAEERGPE